MPYRVVHCGTGNISHEALAGVGRDTGKKWKLPYSPSEMAYRIEIEGDPAYSLVAHVSASRKTSAHD